MERLLNEESGTLGWVALGAYVVAWDVMAPETLSNAVDRALDHPIMKYVAWGVGSIVGAHLFNLIPENVDPIVYIGKAIGAKHEG